MSKLAALKVFEIPELAILVFNHLEKRDLVACALVHSAWHEAVIPLIYHSITINSKWIFRERSFDEDFWNGLRKYSRYIRLLKVYSSSIGDISSLGFSCISLTDLHLDITEDASKNMLWSWEILQLISNNPGISSLELRACSYSLVTFDHHLVVLGLLRYMPGLKKLVIIGTSMGESSVDEIMRCAYRLEELDVTMNRIDKDPIPRTNQQLTGFVLGFPFADLSLKDHDYDDNTHDGPYVPDSQGRRCRQGASLKKFSLVLSDVFPVPGSSEDASLLVRHCCSAEDIRLLVADGSIRLKIMRALENQVNHPAWCLKSLKIGHIWHEDTSILVKILSARSISLVSLWLADCCFLDELLSGLLQNHGKTLQRLTMSDCNELSRGDIKALLSGCSDLRSLEVSNTEDYGGLATLPRECQLQWTGLNGRVFEVFMSEEAYWLPYGQRYSTMEEYETMKEEPIPDDPWRQLQLMENGAITSHIQFLAK